MRVAVTGASGNIGVHLLERLHGEPDVEEVVAISRRPPGEPTGPLADGVTWHAVDISSPDAAGRLTEAFAGCDVVVHLAWLIQPSHAPDVMHATNIEGSRTVFGALRAAGVRNLVYASSVGTYSRAPKQPRQDETWPRDGIEGSLYSRQKAAVERILDGVEREDPQLRVVRIRPAVVTSATAAASQTRYFLGPFVPSFLVPYVPVVPAIPRLELQVVHSEDVAAAFAAAVRSDVRGAVNVADEPVLTPQVIAEVLDARVVPYPLPTAAALAALQATWLLRLQPVDPGWLAMGLGVPVMDTTRARTELGWTPAHDARDALREAVDGVRRGTGGATPVLRPAASLAARVSGGLRSLFPSSGGRI